MTRAQELNEQASIEKFVNGVLAQARPKGTGVAVTHVLVAAAYAAANMTARTATGAIDSDEAHKIFHEAVHLLRAAAPKAGQKR